MTVAYIRTYTNRQSAEEQKTVISNYATSQLIKIDMWYTDYENTSSSHHELENIIRDLNSGDQLIVSDSGQLGKKLAEVMHYILLCIEHNITLYCLHEGYTFRNDIDSKTLAFTFGLISEIEKKANSLTIGFSYISFSTNIQDTAIEN